MGGVCLYLAVHLNAGPRYQNDILLRRGERDLSGDIDYFAYYSTYQVQFNNSLVDYGYHRPEMLLVQWLETWSIWNIPGLLTHDSPPVKTGSNRFSTGFSALVSNRLEPVLTEIN